MEWDYPVFKVDEFFDNQLTVYEQAVPKIDPRYFESNARFNSLSQVSSPSLVDYMGVYEEGDSWVLAVVKATINNSTQYLFLPFTSDIPQPESSPNNMQIQTFGKAAFGFETDSPGKEKRHWQVFDAFTDYKFYQKLINLFLPLKGIPQNHVNAYTTVYESGKGKFIFQSKHEQTAPLLRVEKYEFSESLFVIKGDNFHLDLYLTLPAMIDIEMLKASPKVMGWITYSGEVKLLIGILYK